MRCSSPRARHEPRAGCRPDWDYNANYFGLGARGTILWRWGDLRRGRLRVRPDGVGGHDVEGSDPRLRAAVDDRTTTSRGRWSRPSGSSTCSAPATPSRASPTDMAAGEPGRDDGHELSFPSASSRRASPLSARREHPHRPRRRNDPSAGVGGGLPQSWRSACSVLLRGKANAQELISDSRAFLEQRGHRQGSLTSSSAGGSSRTWRST